MIAYHDKSLAPENDFFNPNTYRVEAWFCKNGNAREFGQTEASSTQAASSFFMLKRIGDGYEFWDGEYPGEDYIYYRLSQSDYPASGDQYWFDGAHETLDFDGMQTITAETLATLGIEAAFEHA